MDLDKVKYWTELSDYDLETADAMFRTGRWLYVGYMCHQCIEKIFKAYWSKKKEDPVPYSHNLINLAQSCGLGQQLSEGQKGFISEIMPLNIEGARKGDLAKLVEIARQLTDGFDRLDRSCLK